MYVQCTMDIRILKLGEIFRVCRMLRIAVFGFGVLVGALP